MQNKKYQPNKYAVIIRKENIDKTEKMRLRKKYKLTERTINNIS